MTVSNQNLPPDQYDGNDSTTEFPITFDFVDPDHIIVTSVDSDNIETVGTNGGSEDYDYTISGSTVTMNAAPATGVTLVIDCETPLTQATDLKRNRAAGAEVYEAALDKLTLLIRDRTAQLARSLVLSATADKEIDTTLPLPSAGGVLGWSLSEDSLENVFSLNGYVISSFAETLLDDNNERGMLTTLKTGYYVDSTVADQGAATDEGNRSIKDLVDAIGTSKKATLVLLHSSTGNTTTYTLTTSETIPSNIDLVVANGAIIDGAGTLTVKGLIKVPRQHFIGSSLTLSLDENSLQRFVYPEWWGIDGVNDEVQIQAAITAMATAKNATVHSSGVVDLDAKAYACNAGIVVDCDAVCIAGKGRSTVIHRTNGGTYDSIYFGPTDTVNDQTYQVSIKNLKIQATGTAMTGGSLIKFESVHGFQMRNIMTQDGFINLHIVGCVGGRVSQFRSYFGSLLGAETASTYHVYIDEGDHATVPNPSEIYFDVFELNGDTNYYCDVGIAVRGADGIWFSDGHVHRVHGHDIWIDPDTDNDIMGLFFTNVFCDTNGDATHAGDSVSITGSTTGNIKMIEFVNCQMGSSVGTTRGNRGIAITNADLTNYTIQGCNIYGHYSHGIYVNAITSQFTIANNRISDNNEGNIGASGIVVTNGNSEFSITNNRIGTDSDSIAMAAGIIAGTSTGCDDFVIKGNVIRGCTDNIQLVLASGGDCVVKDNIPYDEALTGSITIDPTQETAHINSSGGAVTATLGSGIFRGQLKTIVMTDATASSTVSVTNHETSDPEVFTFAQVDDTLVLMWTGTEWITIANSGVAV